MPRISRSIDSQLSEVGMQSCVFSNTDVPGVMINRISGEFSVAIDSKDGSPCFHPLSCQEITNDKGNLDISKVSTAFEKHGFEFLPLSEEGVATSKTEKKKQEKKRTKKSAYQLLNPASLQ